MSIRLRLTLLYSVILALTLVTFSVVVYSVQSQSTLNEQKHELAGWARRAADRLQFSDQLQFDDRRPDEPPWPAFPLDRSETPTSTFGFRTPYVQHLYIDGEVIFRSDNLGEITLPLSDRGMDALRDGKPWAETAVVEGERLLIHTEPVVIAGQVTQAVQVARLLGERDQHLRTLGQNLLIASGVVTAAAFGMGWILSGLVLRPIHRITQTARTIGEERDLSRRVRYAGPNDEIGQLATTFNAMLAQLQVAYQQVQRSLQQQRRFVADVSHELRTPLTTIRGNLGLLRRGPSVSAEEKDDILDDMVDESDRLIRLVNDLLALAHAESERSLENETIRVKPLIEDICRQARLLEPDRTIACADLAEIAAVGDRDALKQVLLILMDNALKHTGGTVTVTTAVADKHVAIRVYDDGPGIDPDVLPHVFERFYRGEEARARPGLGLGLPIAKALVEAQDGAITVDSEAGQGSVITVTLPLGSDNTSEAFSQDQER